MVGRYRRVDGRPGGPSLPISPKRLTRKPGIEPWPFGNRHSVFVTPQSFRLLPFFVDVLCNFSAAALAKVRIRPTVRPHDKAFTFLLGVRFGIGFAERIATDRPAQLVYNPSCFHKLSRNKSGPDIWKIHKHIIPKTIANV
jgi:hypothetical protein